jgi:hypothetical protein
MSPECRAAMPLVDEAARLVIGAASAMAADTALFLD